MKIYVVLKKGYVVNRIKWDGVSKIEHEGDAIIEDTAEFLGIGDWYEESEGVFYMPRTKPNDSNLPEELKDHWNPKELFAKESQ